MFKLNVGNLDRALRMLLGFALSSAVVLVIVDAFTFRSAMNVFSTLAMLFLFLPGGHDLTLKGAATFPIRHGPAARHPDLARSSPPASLSPACFSSGCWRGS